MSIGGPLTNELSDLALEDENNKFLRFSIPETVAGKYATIVSVSGSASFEKPNKGWTAYYAPVCSKKTFAKMAHLTYLKLKRWAKWRHPRKSWRYISHKYWRLERGRWDFAPPKGPGLYRHHQTPIKRYIKVKGNKTHRFEAVLGRAISLATVTG